ncbi:MAG: hypothetical protein EBR09_12705 [Proteobacteria bacterium]|jgi:hypothetical protein|nr:hypothetical protein [Pseudomonadota bacterium]
MAKGSYASPQYALQLLVISVMTLSLLMSRPLEEKQWLVPNKIWLTRLIDPVIQKINWNTKTTLPDFTLTGTQKNKETRNLHEFIQKYTLPEDSDKLNFEEISKNPLSPITRVMIMIGCYGDLNLTANQNTLQMLTSESNAVLFNILLNVFETTYRPLINSQMVVHDVSPKNDHSVCSCLKDFASPVTVNYNPDTETPYTHDTCTIQNVVDYTSVQKNNIDPLLSELNAYFKAFETKYFRITTDPLEANFNGSNAWKKVLVNVTKQDYGGFKSFMEIFESKTQTFNTLGDLKIYLDEYVTTKMFSHNKLRTPKFNSQATFDKLPLEMNSDSYGVYMHKYRNAYQVCSAMGVPKYEVRPITKVYASSYRRIGITFLLLATIVGFSTVFQRKKVEDLITDSSEAQASSNPMTIVLHILSLLLKFILILSLILFLAIISNDSVDEKLVIEKENSIKFVIALIWIFGFVTIFFNVYDAYDTYRRQPDQNYEGYELCFRQIGQDVCIIIGLASLAVAFRLQRGDSDEYVFLSTFSLFLVIGLLQHMSNLVRMMQQYTQEKLFVSDKTDTANEVRGFMEQKLAEQNGNGEGNDQNNNEVVASNTAHMTYHIAYNRVIVTVIIIFGLLAYLTMASSTIQEWTPDIIYSEQHTRIFAVCAFFILCAYDIFFEVLSFKYTQAIFEQQHPRKMMWTSWAIIVSILVLNFHHFFALCHGRQKTTDASCKIEKYVFGG